MNWIATEGLVKGKDDIHRFLKKFDAPESRAGMKSVSWTERLKGDI